MAANINDLVSKVSTGTQRPVSTTVQSSRAAAGTSLSCGDLTGWATDTVVHFQTYKLNGEGKITPGSQTDFKGIVTANTINSVTLTGGTDAGNQVGDVVVALPTADWAFKMAEHALVAHNQDGTIKDGAVNTPGVLAANTVTTAAIADGAVTADKIDAGTIPKFSVYRLAAYNSSATVVIIPFDTKSFDTGNDVDVLTNKGRFTVPVDGYYMFNANSGNSSATSTPIYIQLMVNGSSAKVGTVTTSPNAPTYSHVSGLLKLNAGDYVEAAFVGGGGSVVAIGAVNTYFDGFLVSTT